MRCDGKTATEVQAIVQWALADDFWSRNAQSPKAFRTRKNGGNAPVWVQFERRSRTGKTDAEKAGKYAPRF
jgi:hypothetical protein